MWAKEGMSPTKPSWSCPFNALMTISSIVIFSHYGIHPGMKPETAAKINKKNHNFVYIKGHMVRLFCLIYHDHEVAALNNASFICLCILNLHTLYNRIYENWIVHIVHKKSNYLATQALFKVFFLRKMLYAFLETNSYNSPFQTTSTYTSLYFSLLLYLSSWFLPPSVSCLLSISHPLFIYISVCSLPPHWLSIYSQAHNGNFSLDFLACKRIISHWEKNRNYPHHSINSESSHRTTASILWGTPKSL